MTFDDIYNKSIKFPVYACQKKIEVSWESTGKRIIFLTSIMFQLLPCLVVVLCPFQLKLIEPNDFAFVIFIFFSFFWKFAHIKNFVVRIFRCARENIKNWHKKISFEVECHAQAFAHLTDNQFRSIHNLIIISLN